MRRWSGSRSEELAERLEVVRLGRRVLDVLDHVAHRGRPLPQGERREPGDEDRQRPERFVHGRPQRAHSSTGPPNSAPSRTALPPIGVSSASASVAPSPYRSAPQRSARLLARQHDQAGEREQRDRHVGATPGRAPSRPPGTPTPGTPAGGRPRPRWRGPRRASGGRAARRCAYATPAMARKSPATGLPSGHSTASTIASQ